MWRKIIGFFALILAFSSIIALAGAECNVCQNKVGTVTRGQTSELATPITLVASISRIPVVGEEAVIAVTLTSIFDAPGTSFSIKLPEGAELVSGVAAGTIDLAANSPRTIKTTIKFTKPGDYRIGVSALHAVDASNSWGDVKTLYLTIGASASRYTPAQTNYLHMATQRHKGESSVAANTSQALPGTSGSIPNFSITAKSVPLEPITLEKGFSRATATGPPAAIGSSNITVSGAFNYDTTDSDYRDSLDTTHGTWLLVEIYDYDTGNSLEFAWANSSGHFQTGEFNPNGSSLGVAWYTYAKFGLSGGNPEMRVISDPAGGISGVSDYSYIWGSTALTGYKLGSNFDIGTWYPYYDDPDLGALWLLEDLNRALTSLYWAGMPNPGQGTIVWYNTSTDGTYYDLGGQIHLKGEDAKSADTSVHEYGHNVMYRVYGNWWPPEEHCPNPHYLVKAEDCSCAWTEGWADFLPLAVNYDAVFTWPSGATQDLETPTWITPYFDKGLCVEGRVAGALNDIYDLQNDGADQLEYGLSNISTIMIHNRTSYFSSFLPTWISGHGWPDTAAKPIYQNTIDVRPTKIGIYYNGYWYLDANNNGLWDASDFFSIFGAAGDQPVVGDWNGDGREEIGVFRNGTWYLDASGNGYWGTGDISTTFGATGDQPVVGEWNGDGKDEIGVYRGTTFYLDASGNGYWGPGDLTGSFGIPGWMPVSGDWNGDGKDEIGVFSSGDWYIDCNGNLGWNPADDRSTYFGVAGDLPVTGHWNITRDGDEIGVFRNGYYFLDCDNNLIWNPAHDQMKGPFGFGGALPGAGYWN